MPSPPMRVRISQSVSNKLLVTKVDPIYPDEARRKHVQGAVTLAVVVGDTGTVTNLRRINGDALLVPSAIEAVKKWVYRPYVLNGHPIGVETQVTIKYTLPD